MRSGLLKLFGLCVLSGVLVASLAMPMAFGAGAFVNETTSAMSNMSATMAKGQMPLTTKVTDRNGKPLAYFYDDYRIPTPKERISQTMKVAITAIEDKRFWDHRGVDWQGTMRAMAANISSGSVTQGASTITQQYVKNYRVHVLADNDVERQEAQATTVARKLREARIAVELERTMSKKEILAGYLNVVPFGNQTFGVGAAAQTYFGTTPDKLSIPQSALLAAIVNAPGALNPNTNPQDALQRRNLVIDLMASHSNRFRISEAAAERAKKQPLDVLSPLGRPPNGCVTIGDGAANGFFCNYVLDYLRRAGIDRDKLDGGGYTIRTTMSREDTQEAKKAAEAQVPTRTPGIANAMAVVEPGKDKHKVRALVANRDYGNDASKGQTARDIVSDVQPFGAGSVFKIFTAAAALKQGKSIHDVIPVPPTYSSTKYGKPGDPYTVGNAEGVAPGPRTLQDALATSPNTGFIMLEEKVGVDNVVNMASKLGLRRSLNKTDAQGKSLQKGEMSEAETVKKYDSGSFTLGVSSVSVLELSNVMATISSGGVWCPPTPLESVKDRNGDPVRLPEAPCEQVVSPHVAAALAQGLGKDHLPGGTSHAAAKSSGWNRPVMAKTGTTQRYHSAAFVGATPQMAGAVLTFTSGSDLEGICVGGPGKPPYLCGDNGGNLYGGTVPGRTWYNAMTKIHEGLPVAPLPGIPPRP
ncbi:membrane peptidoglycan carboxypeptidase [Saccharopolyspora lacisalsi]|uniref:Membrane peptidoglycan carboxypeptidase n=1 Tax=Halosaccharopolyspora lacisalsi TaxID=1000566 RepID=A0A839DVT1_9PSEU|nr:transglycosylase domain-containing protein [Halosaccharopolyspora lacisalsi]MBA8825143.1 membrane peptidoglycan carboxypeptidase [Halosaccharopolyspora lacisalsi]